MLKSFFIKNNTILGNVKNQSQIVDIVALNDIISRKASTLIAKSWDSKEINHCGEVIYKINIKGVN